jgi:hypothetical protein
LQSDVQATVPLLLKGRSLSSKNARIPLSIGAIDKPFREELAEQRAQGIIRKVPLNTTTPWITE